jgi:hypothetical protein
MTAVIRGKQIAFWFGDSREIAIGISCSILKEKRFEMHLFILGTVLGAGLVLAFQELHRTSRGRRLARIQKDSMPIEDSLVCTCWTQEAGGGHAYYCELLETPKPKRFRPITHP